MQLPSKEQIILEADTQLITVTSFEEAKRHLADDGGILTIGRPSAETSVNDADLIDGAVPLHGDDDPATTSHFLLDFRLPSTPPGRPLRR